MDASRTGHLGAAFVMHDADLDALNRLLKDFGDDIEYTITGKDGISLTFTEVNKLRAFENPSNTRLSINKSFQRSSGTTGTGRSVESTQPAVAAASSATSSQKFFLLRLCSLRRKANASDTSVT